MDTIQGMPPTASSPTIWFTPESYFKCCLWFSVRPLSLNEHGRPLSHVHIRLLEVLMVSTGREPVVCSALIFSNAVCGCLLSHHYQLNYHKGSFPSYTASHGLVQWVRMSRTATIKLDINKDLPIRNPRKQLPNRLFIYIRVVRT
jgi:hypothetical protein